MKAPLAPRALKSPPPPTSTHVHRELWCMWRQDHSKIAVLPASGTLCVGDINRASTQYKR
jgi:hypothetical protein